MNFDDLADDATLTADQAPAADRSAIVIRDNISRVESALSEFDKISAGLADLAARFPHDLAYDVATTKGMAEAVAHRAAWRDPRINVEKFRKAAKAPVLALGKDIDARASWLTEQLLLGERPVDEQIKAEESRKEAVKQAVIDAEFGRVLAIQEALAEVSMQAMVSGLSSVAITKRLEELRAATLDPLVFQEMLEQAKAAQRAVIDKLELALKAKLHDEAEVARLASERAELDALRLAAAAQRLKDEAELAAATKREAEAQAEQRTAARAEQARLDAESAAARVKADRAAAAQRAAAQAAHDAAMQAERAAAAEARKAADAREANEKAKRQKAEAAAAKLRDAAPLLLTALKAALAATDGWAAKAKTAIEAAE